MKHYTVYKVTNTLNGMYYIGCHVTSDPHDNYMGSGLFIKRALVKYGLENFTKEILADFTNAEEMFEHEKIIVNWTDKHAYNLKEGGKGGWEALHTKHKNDSSFYSRPHSEETKHKLSNMAKLRPKRILTEEDKLNKSIARKKWVSKNPDFAKGENNSAYGHVWVTNGEFNKRILNCSEIPHGFRRGMCRK